MKRALPFLALLLSVTLLTGCMGTPVVYYCDCPTEGETDTKKTLRGARGFVLGFTLVLVALGALA